MQIFLSGAKTLMTMGGAKYVAKGSTGTQIIYAIEDPEAKRLLALRTEADVPYFSVVHAEDALDTEADPVDLQDVVDDLDGVDSSDDSAEDPVDPVEDKPAMEQKTTNKKTLKIGGRNKEVAVDV